MPEWTADNQFQDFAQRLDRAGLLGDAHLLDRVLHDAELARLVQRPLLARMLTYVSTGDADVRDQTSLYQRYISKSAATNDIALARVGCDIGSPSARLWRDAAWHAFADRGGVDALPFADLVTHLHDLHQIDLNCAYRALAGIIDAVPASDGLTAAFLHYSFYEFLVAQHVAIELAAAQQGDDIARGATALKHDLPPEMRRHLVLLLQAAATDLYAWPRWLADVYKAQRQQPDPERRTVANLVAYISARLGVPADEALQGLLLEETDPFLRNSLNWALARRDNHQGLDRYLADLAADVELASLNRGYLLYYYGDLSRHNPPPYRDDDPHVPWSQTRARLEDKFLGPQHASVPDARQALDLYTWFDLMRIRADRLNEREATVAASAMGRLAVTGLPETVRGAVETLYALVRPS
jgi:hypothetical protein